MPLETVKVDRSTPWGNPFRVVRERAAWGVTLRDEASASLYRDTEDDARQLACDLFRDWCVTYGGQIGHKHNVGDLRGRNLACWCPESSPCHADILLEIANGQ